MIARVDMKLLRWLVVVALLLFSASMHRSFASDAWQARAHDGPPGTGCWSDAAESVRVDEEGLIHLRLSEAGGVWYQAEIRSRTIARYGSHRFYVISRLDELQPSVVLGLFLYGDDKHEIDVEISRAFGGESDVGIYVVQPSKPHRSHSFPIELTGIFTTHEIHWGPEVVRFSSWHGHCEAGPCGGWIEQWEYRGADVPAESDRLAVRMNLWLKKNRPVPDAPQDVILRYEYAEPR